MMHMRTVMTLQKYLIFFYFWEGKDLSNQRTTARSRRLGVGSTEVNPPKMQENSKTKLVKEVTEKWQCLPVWIKVSSMTKLWIESR